MNTIKQEAANFDNLDFQERMHLGQRIMDNLTFKFRYYGATRSLIRGRPDFPTLDAMINHLALCVYANCHD